MSSPCISALLCTLPSKSFVLSILTLARKYSKSGKADTSRLPEKIFPIFSEWLSRSSTVPPAVVVIIGVPFLGQLTAIAQHYIGPSSVSSSVLVSLRATSAFLHSVSGIGGFVFEIREGGVGVWVFFCGGCGCWGVGGTFLIGFVVLWFGCFTCR